MITFTPDPIFLQLGPLPIYWYGIAYAVGLAVSYAVLVRQARRFGQDPEIVGNGIIVIAIAALVGGRLYHVIDQWQLYQGDLLKIILPPYSGLGVYGGLVTGTLAFIVLVRVWRLNAWVWADVVAPALFTMQAIGRWGNFFNQELYGPPTTQPWGVVIDCLHRVAAYPCSAFPEATTGFHPLFLYESISGLLGATILIWLSRGRPYRLRRGDQLLIFFIWYGVVRFLLENLRTGNWFVGGVAAAQIMSVLFVVGAFVVLVPSITTWTATPMGRARTTRTTQATDPRTCVRLADARAGQLARFHAGPTDSFAAPPWPRRARSTRPRPRRRP
ncbi:MAG: Phosphatidylglycerol--prolipoprotein diacylglyceryl transferase [Chloroflexi bacterium]|nr:Phosphatidylglycerol--prolipoprotein diacylglyceryl transferase [Chloroflexota bacterium]